MLLHICVWNSELLQMLTLNLIYRYIVPIKMQQLRYPAWPYLRNQLLKEGFSKFVSHAN